MNTFKNYLLAFSLLSSCLLQAKTIYYVKTDGAGDGSSWSNAANNIQTMIDKAVSGDEVWVAKGTYYPTTETIARDSRSLSFVLKDRVNVYGGFNGTEEAIWQRSLADIDGNGKLDSCEFANPTILSGNVDGVPDVWTKSINSDNVTWTWKVSGNEGNCYSVITGSNLSVIIDGFNVIGGNSNSTGGGINISNSTDSKTVIIENCLLSNCLSKGSGGGIYINSPTSYSVIKILNTNIDNCLSGNLGGGIFSNVLNGSADNANAVYLLNCKVTNSCASNGGGICFKTSKDGSLKNCYVISCSASSSGGGIYASLSDSNPDFPSISNSFISNCSSKSDGGGLYFSTGLVYKFSYITNCTISNCYSATNGNGIYIYAYETNCFVTNCYIASCAGSSNDIYAYSYFYSNVYVKNCAATVSSITQNMSNVYTSGNTSPDPNLDFFKPTSFKGVATTNIQNTEILNANWHLKEGSLKINAGINNATYTSSSLGTLTQNLTTGNDLEGNTRLKYGTIDIGAYEYYIPIILMPATETFNSISDFSTSNLFFKYININSATAIKWSIINQKADFTWQTNLTTTYSQPIFTYQIDGTKSSKVYLRYDMYFQAYAGTISPLGTEKLNVEFSTDLVTWSTIATYSNANGTIANQTYKHDISTLAAGKTFFIRFNANGANSNRIEKWELDNVIIDADGLSAVNTVPEDKYNYSVNNGVLNIANLGQVATIQLLDINGKILANKVVSQTVNFTLPVHGVYLVKVTSESGIENKKIVW